MPLSKKKSEKEFNQNVGELMHSFRKSGMIGSSHPENKEQAQKQALAIAFRQRRRTFLNKYNKYNKL